MKKYVMSKVIDMNKTIELDASILRKALEIEGVPLETTERILRQLTIKPPMPRLHSSMTLYEAQDWLAANDMAGATYWRAEPLTLDLIAAVGERLEAAGDTERWIFDCDWQRRYLLGDLS